jgi:hypothetical protein
MAMYMKGGEGFLLSELDEAGSEGDNGTGKSSANTLWSLSMSRSRFGNLKRLNSRTKRKRASLRVSKEQHIVIYPIRGFSLQRKLKMDLLTVSFFFPRMAQRAQLSSFKTSTSVHCCAENAFFYGYPCG